MARADFLKELIHSYHRGDNDAFEKVVQLIIADERKKRHSVLANELEKILRNGSNTSKSNGLAPLYRLPLDADKGIPLLEVRTPKHYLREVILDDRTSQTIERAIEEFCGWEVLAANGLTPTRRLLFCGPSGCGKTITAEAIASEIGLPLLYVRFDTVVSSLLGETASNLRKIFEFAGKEQQWVMFFDEFDAIGRSRDDPTEHSEIKRVVNSFLQILDSFNGRSLIIAATNFEQVIDPSLWRRFDEIIRFEKPDTFSLELLVKKRLQPLAFSDQHVRKIAKQLKNGTYADAERVCLDIRKACALGGTQKISSKNVDVALERYTYRRNILEHSTQDSPPSIDRD